VSAQLVDPEDDLPSPNYGGDFETTTIPHYSSGISAAAPAAPPANGAGFSGSPHGGSDFSASPQNGSDFAASPQGGSISYGVLNQPDPLPYVGPNTNAGHAMAGPVEIEPIDAQERAKAAGRRGTQDLGLLLLRVVVGVLFIGHGLQKAFGWWGGAGLDGFRAALADAGYEHAGLLTYLGAGAQIVAGVLLVLGLFTPVAAAGALAYVLNSALVIVAAQQADGYLAVFGPNGIEYLLVLVVAIAAIILVGPGRYGFDAGRGWARRPFVGSFVALILGIGGGIAAWILLHGSTGLL
jgi:putative oxidoreductase